jgi:hypothetical protein
LTEVSPPVEFGGSFGVLGRERSGFEDRWVRGIFGVM